MDILLRIKQELKKDGRNIKWLAIKFDVSPNHLRMVLRGERPLSKANFKIAKDIWPDIDVDLQSLKDEPLWKDDANS